VEEPRQQLAPGQVTDGPDQYRARNDIAAAAVVEDGMTGGLSPGSAVARPLPALVRRCLSLRCVATSPRTADGWIQVAAASARTRE
jgi:hypothetical protein